MEVVPVLGPGVRLVPESEAGAGPFTAGGATYVAVLLHCNAKRHVHLLNHCLANVVNTEKKTKKVK